MDITTYADLQVALANLSTEQLKQTIRVVGERLSLKVNELWVVDEDQIDPSGDGWEPVSNYVNEPEILRSEPVIVAKGAILLVASQQESK